MSRVFRGARGQVVDNGGNPFENNLYWRRGGRARVGWSGGWVGALCLLGLERDASRVGVCGPLSTSR
jgi:hypothetical protein